MTDFSESDINAAKRRVQEMRNRAQRFTDEENPTSEKQKIPQLKQNVPDHNEKKDNQEESADKDEDKSLFIILALILLLSKEGADNTLILALLYLLL